MQQYNKVFPEELKSIGFQLSWGNTHKRNKAQDVSSVHEFPSHTAVDPCFLLPLLKRHSLSSFLNRHEDRKKYSTIMLFCSIS